MSSHRNQLSNIKLVKGNSVNKDVQLTVKAKEDEINFSILPASKIIVTEFDDFAPTPSPEIVDNLKLFKQINSLVQDGLDEQVGSVDSFWHLLGDIEENGDFFTFEMVLEDSAAYDEIERKSLRLAQKLALIFFDDETGEWGLSSKGNKCLRIYSALKQFRYIGGDIADTTFMNVFEPEKYFGDHLTVGDRDVFSFSYNNVVKDNKDYRFEFLMITRNEKLPLFKETKMRDAKNTSQSNISKRIKRTLSAVSSHNMKIDFNFVGQENISAQCTSLFSYNEPTIITVPAVILKNMANTYGGGLEFRVSKEEVSAINKIIQSKVLKAARPNNKTEFISERVPLNVSVIKDGELVGVVSGQATTKTAMSVYRNKISNIPETVVNNIWAKCYESAAIVKVFNEENI